MKNFSCVCARGPWIRNCFFIRSFCSSSSTASQFKNNKNSLIRFHSWIDFCLATSIESLCRRAKTTSKMWRNKNGIERLFERARAWLRVCIKQTRRKAITQSHLGAKLSPHVVRVRLWVVSMFMLGTNDRRTQTPRYMVRYRAAENRNLNLADVLRTS